MNIPDKPGALSSRPVRAEEDFEKALRPSSLDDFIGQQKIKDNLRVFMTAALQRGEALDHVLLSGPPGLGKCITPDSLVLTGDGLRRFEDLIPGEMEPGSTRPLEIQVYGVDGPERTSHVYYSGRVPTRRLTTRAGLTLEGTPHHPVLAATPEGLRWMRLEDLRPGDYVAAARGTQLWPQRTHRAAYRPDASSARRLGLPVADGRRLHADPQPWRFASVAEESRTREVVLDADFAYLLGACVGDGHMERRGRDPGFVITCDEPEMQAELRRIALDHFGRTPQARRFGKKAARLAFSPCQGRTCRAFGLKPGSAAEKDVPAAVLAGSREVVVGFLQGLFDADGHARTDGYVEWSTRSEMLARQVHLLLANLGVVAYRSVREVQGSPCWRLFVGGEDARRFYDRVGFRLARKQARASCLPEAHGWDRGDLVPGAAPLLHELLAATRPHARAVHKAFGHVRSGDRTPTRRQVERLLALLPDAAREHPAYWRLQALADPSIHWDRVEEIAASEAEAYDFVVPGTHSFVANGLFNHNTTLALIIAEEMGAKVTTTSGPVLDKPASIAGILTNLEEGDVLFIDEIHRLSPVVEEYLYSAMEDYHIDIVIDAGPNARSVKITLPPFTLVGATTRKGLLTAPLRARFGIDFRYDYYTADLLQQIVVRSAEILQVEITADGAHEIARRSRGTPRIANRLLRRTRDFAEVEGDGRITRAIADRALNALDVDEHGLDEMDTRILLTLIEKFAGGPTGLSNLAVSVGEDAGTIEEVYEPYLIQEGFMERTPRGRVAAPRAYAHFDLTPPSRSGNLFGE